MKDLAEIKYYEITKFNIVDLYALKKNEATQDFVNQLNYVFKASLPNSHSFKSSAFLRALKFSFLFMDVVINSSDKIHAQGVLHTVQEGVKYILVKALGKTMYLNVTVVNEGLKLKIELSYKENISVIFYIVYSGELT